MSTPTSDEQLVRAARAGSDAAWTTLVERYYSVLLRYLTACLGQNNGLASDLTQETFLVAMTDLDQPGAERAFAGWLYRIAHHRLQRVWQRQHLHPTLSLEGLTEREDRDLPLSCQTATLDEQIVEDDLIAQVLTELSPPVRQALLLNALSGYSAPEVAAILGTSKSAAERRISRGKAWFRMRYNMLVTEHTAHR